MEPARGPPRGASGLTAPPAALRGVRALVVLSGLTAANEVAGLRGLSVPGAVAATLSDVVAALD